MAKMKYDVANVESSNFESPQPGTYSAKIFSVVDRTEMEGKNDWEVVLEITKEGRFKGSRIWYYLNWGEPSRWKVKEFVDALGMKAKGVLDSDRLVGKEVGIVVVADSWQGEYKGRISKFLQLSAVADDDEDEEDVVDDEDIDADEDDGDEEEQDYSSMTLKELREEAEARSLHLSAKTKKDKDALIEALEEDDEENADEEDDEEDEPEPPKTKAGKQKVGGKKAAEVVAPEEDDEDDDEDDEEADDEDDDGDDSDSDEEDEDYTEWSETELREECEARGLPTRGSKKALIARIEKDNAAAAKPF